MFLPKVRIVVSSNGMFLFVSLWPYQYARGRSAFDAIVVGAEVAADPRGFAGEYVGSGPCIGAADIAPGTDQPP